MSGDVNIDVRWCKQHALWSRKMFYSQPSARNRTNGGILRVIHPSAHMSSCVNVMSSFCLHTFCLHIRSCTGLSVCLNTCLSWHFSIFKSVCLHICLSARLSVYTSVCPRVFLSTHLSVHTHFWLHIYLSTHISTHQFVYTTVCVHICRHIGLSTQLFVYTSVRLHICLYPHFPGYSSVNTPVC